MYQGCRAETTTPSSAGSPLQRTTENFGWAWQASSPSSREGRDALPFTDCWLRLLWSVLTGTVATSRITHLSEAKEVRIEAGGSPMALAIDGEALGGVNSVTYRVLPRALAYYCPHP